MKQIVVLIFIVLSSNFGYASDISDDFSEKYRSLLPKESTSVRSDYLFEQIALGSEYNIKMLEQLNSQNDQLNEKFDMLLEKFNLLIEQNKKLIKLLEKDKK